jgi:predicted transposase/invertase (TIGR01784 family)
VSTDEIRIPGTSSEQNNSRRGNFFPEARRAAQAARQFFDSKNLIRPTGDLLFKKLMTESPDALLDLLNRILKPERRFISAVVLNSEILPETDGEKAARLDVLVECDNGTKVDIEMQCGPNEALEQRAMFYASRIYASSLPEGQTYGQLPHCAVIFILEEAYFPHLEDGHNEFQMCRMWPPEKPRVVLGKELPSLHFVELGKLRSSGAKEDPILLPWVGFMLPASPEEWNTIASEDAMFSELKKKVESYSADHELAMRQRAIDEGRMGRQIEMAGAYNRGKEEGREAERRYMAQKLLAKGMSKSEIAELQGISLEELERLLGGDSKSG